MSTPSFTPSGPRAQPAAAPRRRLGLALGSCMLALAALGLGCGLPGTRAANRPAATVPPARQPGGPVFLVVMENHEYGQVIGSPDAPYLNGLAAGGILVENAHGLEHPSLPNYLGLFAGDTFGVTDDCTECLQNARNLVDALEARGRVWAGYMEDMPAPCFVGASADGYVQEHNPFIYFQNIRTNAARCRRVVPLSQFDADLASDRLPDLAWITPNLRHDTHDAPVAEGDRWLAELAPRIVASSAWRDGALLIIAWDEGTTDSGCCGGVTGGHIPLVILRGGGPSGAHITEAVTLYSVLRTIEDALGVERLGHSADPDARSLVDLALTGT